MVQSKTRRGARFLIALLIAPILALFPAGCAQKQSAPVATVKPYGLTPNQPRTPGRAYAEVELEDDGGEAQQPPLVRRQPQVDDPNEPYSPNYGRVTSWEDDLPTTKMDEGSYAPLQRINASGTVPFQRSMLR